MALDVQKALVRIEFPKFEEGCKDVTFRKVFQLNARVSDKLIALLYKSWCIHTMPWQ